MGRSPKHLSENPAAKLYIYTRFDEAIRFRYLYGHHGHRIARFDSGWTTAEDCVVGAPDVGGYVVYRGRRRFEMVPGMALLTPSGQRQRITDNGSPELRQHWAKVRFTLFGTVDLFTLVALPDRLTGEAAAEAARLVIALNAAAGACRRLDLAALSRREEAGYRLLRLLLEHATPIAGLGERLAAIERVQPVLRLMEERLDEGLDRLALARAAGLSNSRLHSVFTAALGESPYAYLLRLRLRRAQDLLAASDLSVQQVAEAAGFGDAFHFSRSFKRAFGASPRGYRRQARASW